ncbi:MAG: tetratricopeptide repeat protein [Ignavibacteria bacterium]|nr:tetratricopeptide repeat protein [Ignavibacteria bacterium]
MTTTAPKKKNNMAKIPEITPNRSILYTILIIIAVSLISYSSILDNSFTNWDDEEMLVNNPTVRSLSAHNIYEIFTTPRLNHYHPLVTISYAVEYHFFELNPFVYHLINLIFHIASSILVFLVILKLFRKYNIALIVSILFAVHPLHVESVAWITERKDMLYSFFMLLSLYFYIVDSQRKDKKLSFYVFLFFILSCLSKASAVTFPIILIAVDYFQNKEFHIRTLKEKIPLFVVSILFGIINLKAQYSQHFEGMQLEVPNFAFYDRILIFFYNYCFYIYQAIFPINLSAFYPYPDPLKGSLPVLFYLAPILFGLIIYLLYRFSKSDKILVFGILFYTITILPVLQIIPVGRAIAADRFAYIPLLGVFLIVAYYMDKLYTLSLKKPILQKLALGLFIVYVLLLSYSTRVQGEIWKNSMTLYSDMISKYPNNAIGYNNRGTLFLENRKYTEAENDFTSAIRVNANYAAAYNNLGLVYSAKANYDKAIEYFNKAIELNSRYAEAYMSLGLVYSNKNEIDKSIDYYKKAVDIDPNFAIAYNNLGKAYGTKGDNNSAISSFRKAVEIDPEYSTAHFNLGAAFFKTGNNAEGINEMKTAAKLGNTGAIDFCRKNNISWN